MLSLADQLKTNTETNHQQLEKQLVTRMKAVRSKEKYTDLLQLFYTYFGGLEEEIDQYINPAYLADYAKRRKTDALVKDIVDLGGVLQSKASGVDLPQLKNHLQAFGALYVIEGSTLGGQIISKMMAKQLDLQGDIGLTFFKGYGDNSVPMWNVFKQALNAQTQTQEDVSTVTATANETFLKFKKWIDKAS